MSGVRYGEKAGIRTIVCVISLILVIGYNLANTRELTSKEHRTTNKVVAVPDSSATPDSAVQQQEIIPSIACNSGTAARYESMETHDPVILQQVIISRKRI